MIGILGGTFDPVHIGHLRVSLDALQACGLDQVRLIPNKVPPHRPQPLASAQQRLAMLHLAVAQEPNLVVDDCELQRETTSYTVDTLDYLHQQYPSTPLVFLMGEDAFTHFEAWQRWRTILALAHLVILRRPQQQQQICPNSGIWQRLQSHIIHEPIQLHSQEAGKILPLTVTALDISATRIRHDLQAGRNVRYLLPESVLTYLTSQDIYTRF